MISLLLLCVRPPADAFKSLHDGYDDASGAESDAEELHQGLPALLPADGLSDVWKGHVLLR